MTPYFFGRIPISAQRLALVVSLITLPVVARAQVSNSVKGQISDILAIKGSFSAGEKKLSSNLAFASRKAQAKPLGKAANLVRANVAGADGLVRVVIRGKGGAAARQGVAQLIDGQSLDGTSRA